MMTFTVAAKGVGRKDYSKLLEHSIEPFITPSLTQAAIVYPGTYILDTVPFPQMYYLTLPLPQTDGSWNYEATIPVYFHELIVSARTNYLVGVSLVRYDNLADCIAGLIAERFATKFGYGSIILNFSRGIGTIVGSVYEEYIGCWSGDATFDITYVTNGIASELTPPWWPYAS